MDAIDAIKTRCSVRKFSDTPLEKGLIEKIVDCGRRAPTARNEQPWEFIAVTKKDALKAMADITDHGKFIQGAACAIVVCCKDTKYYLEDGCAATANMLVASTALGLGSCWVAGDKKPYCEKMLAFLKVTAGYRLVSIIALGYPQAGTKVPDKRPLEGVLHRELF